MYLALKTIKKNNKWDEQYTPMLIHTAYLQSEGDSKIENSSEIDTLKKSMILTKILKNIPKRYRTFSKFTASKTCSQDFKALNNKSKLKVNKSK